MLCYSSLLSSASDNPKRLWQAVKHTPAPQILLTATHHFSWHLTCRQLCFFFHRQNIQTPSFSHQQHHLHTHPLLLLLPFISQFSLLLRNPKSTRYCPNKQFDSDQSPPGSQRMFICTCFYNHQYCQPLPHFGPVSSHSQGICHLSTA